jgi:GNAT superfamily N-acetyltransferase
MTALDVLDRSHIGDIAALCRRAMTDAPSEEELDACLFTPDQETIVRGDPAVGVVVSARWQGEGYVRLLAVDPAHRLRGHGRSLLRAAERDLSGSRSVTVGADPPYWLFPGVETSQTAMLCLLERLRYQRVEANFNVAVDLEQLPPAPGGAVLAEKADRDEVERWTEAHWPNWTREVLRALDKSTLLVSRDSKGISGFCAYDVNRSGLLGPVAARPDLVGKGAGAPLLLGALHRMKSSGRRFVEVAWVGPIVPYARVGGVVSRVYFVYRKALA